MGSNETLLLSLIKLALGKSTECSLPNAFNWGELFELSMRQCVPAVAFDGLSKCFSTGSSGGESGTDKIAKLRWYSVVVSLEKQYAKHERIIADLAAFYQKNGFRMMLLKGYGLSKFWPTPNHRPTGDIDIYLTETEGEVPAWQRADNVLAEELGIEVDFSHHHHSVFPFEGATVENHFDFVNVHSHRSNRWIESEFKRLAELDSEEYVFGNGAKVLLPSPLLNCLFVARHNAIHFAAEHLTLRQLLDWALFVEKRHADIDWAAFWQTSQKMGMEKFVLCMIYICVEQLNFNADSFHVPEDSISFPERERSLIDKVLDNILHPTDGDASGKGLTYIARRYKLWRENLWKHRIVYTDSVLSTFLAQIKSHLMKPASIFGN